jgi:AcrR family transcriptional regulator
MASSEGRRTRNRRGEGARLREEIIRAAARLIEETGGQDPVTLRAIARSARITAPSIYSHFSDLNEVIEAVVTSTFRLLVSHLRREVAGETDPVARLHAACRAYVTFGLEHPHQYRVLFARNARVRPGGPGKSVSTMPGAEAFAFLLDGIQACVDAGRSRSTEPAADATALWVALHGYVGLQTGAPDFPWPPDGRLIGTLTDRLARLD